jgi:hypothetical protein
MTVVILCMCTEGSACTVSMCLVWLAMKCVSFGHKLYCSQWIVISKKNDTNCLSDVGAVRRCVEDAGGCYQEGIGCFR